MALGSNEASLLDLTGAFASVRSGRRVEPWGIAAFGAEGTGLRSLGTPSANMQELPYRRQLTHLLQEVVEGGTGRGAALNGETVAGKTGTSQDYRDAWFVGFTETLVAGVWVGNDDRTPMKSVTGGSLPAEIWKRFVAAAASHLQQSEPMVVRTDEDHRQTDQPKCDANACSATYHSFRASDCTYQSYGGQRKVCTKGGQPQLSNAEVQGEGRRRGQKNREATISGREPSDDLPASPSPAMSLGGAAASGVSRSSPPTNAPASSAGFGPETLKRYTSGF